MSFKSQLAADLANIIDSEEISETVTHTPRNGVPVTNTAIVVTLGESDGEWSGGSAIVATATLEKAKFPACPQPNDPISTANNTWYVGSLIGESPASWTVKMFSEHKPR